jgi:hypothetical protein
MEPSEPRIEIFAPFGEAFETTKKILFQPFDLTKWFVIGFTAWLATMFNGGSFNYRRDFGNGDWDWKAHTHGQGFSLHDVPPWVIPLAIGGGLLLLAIVVLLLWLNSRGRFMFTDCIVRNRGAIVEPWHEFRTEGNRYFVIQIVVAFCSMFVLGGLALIFVFGWAWNSPTFPPPPTLALSLLSLLGAILFLVVGLIIGLIFKFMIPVMYRQRCNAMHALRAVWQLIAAHPVPFLLFALFYVVLWIAGVAIACIAGCVTCCIAALPYIGTVLLLPVVMFLFVYPLCFIRQFGDPYDVWAVVRPTEPPPPPSVPPVQETLPPV